MTGRDTPDVLIVGAGIAGLYAALQLSPRPVAILSPTPVGSGAASTWAQAGLAAAFGEDDSPQCHAADTHRTGCGLTLKDTVDIVTQEAPIQVRALADLGVPFDRDQKGGFLLGHEAAHSRRRIVGVGGDRTGRAIMSVLLREAHQATHITFLESTRAEALAVQDTRVHGIFTQQDLINARATLLATGGIGHLYQTTTNPPQSAGDGLSMAALAGAQIANAEFVQFHPTAISAQRDPAPLATEALRGEGAYLLSQDGRRVMLDIHPEAELAPRDVVARTIARYLHSGQEVFLDATPVENLAERFPEFCHICQTLNLSPEHVPVAPAAHYHMGGIAVDPNARTSLDGLWACGETADSGAHGANRLASNSLTESLVMAARAAQDIHTFLEKCPPPEQVDPPPALNRTAPWQQTLRAHLSTHVGVERTAVGLRKVLKYLLELEEDHQAHRHPMVQAAKLITASALTREESRGAHFRIDFPQTTPEYEYRTLLTLEDANTIACEARETQT